VNANIVDYLSEPPSKARILQLADWLECSVLELLRRNEADFKEATDLPALDDDDALAAWVEAHPKVLERPIVVDDEANKAIMGRPPENVQDLLPR
jgi:arsenate reductase